MNTKTNIARRLVANSRPAASQSEPPPKIPSKAQTTTVKARGKRKIIVEYTNIINPKSISPLRANLRYSLDPLTLGRLECLARSRFEISKLAGDNIPINIDSSEEVRTVLAKSVYCSSAIEGEHIRAKNVPLSVAATLSNEDLPTQMSKDEKHRVDAMRNIYKAFLWALSRTDSVILTFDFVLELHQKMFSGTFDSAGKLKTEDVAISDEEDGEKAEYNILTLPHRRTERYLRALIDRLNRSWDEAEKAHSHSLFLLCAEFVIDFLAIHPFADGNGRTARLLSTYLLERAGYHFARFYPVEQIIMEKRSRYYNALHVSQKNWFGTGEDLTEWIKFYTLAVYIQYTRALEEIRDRPN